MTNRYLTRIMGGIAALTLSAIMVSSLAYSGILNGNANTALADGMRTQSSKMYGDYADCSSCNPDQVCCYVVNGQCGCFPGGIVCPRQCGG